MEPIIGIDLGTTNSVASIVQNGTPRVIVDPQSGDSVLPSVVGVSPTGDFLIGHPALNQASLFPDATIRSIKRKMGENVSVSLGDKTMTPPHVSALILGRLRQWAEADLGCPINKAVITVPAYFDDEQREATRLAGELAGLEVMRIINEPTAAALVYDPKTPTKQQVLVYDLGGGTFDVSIVMIEAGVVEVLSTFGDTQLGGDDFDALLCERLAQSLAEIQTEVREDKAAMMRLSMAAESAKRRLSFETFTSVAEEFLLRDNPQSHLETTLERSDYEDAIEDLLQRTIACVDSALQQANLHTGQLDKVILVGGSTRTPMVERILIEKLGHQPCGEVDPDLCVSLGAAIQGALLAGQDVQRALVDITPHSLGIRCCDNPYDDADKFAPIVHRGSALPCKRSETFYTVQFGQPEVQVDVYQGESSHVHDNRLIGSVVLDNLDPNAPPDSPVSVSFSLNLNGMLEVRAVDRKGGRETHATIRRANQNERSDDLVSRSAEASKQQIAGWLGRDPQADLEESHAGRSVSADAEATDDEGEQRLDSLIASIKQVRSAASEDDVAEMDQLLLQLRDAVNRRDTEAFDQAAETLDDLLFYLQDA